MKRTIIMPALLFMFVLFISVLNAQNNDDKKPEYKITPQEQATKITDKLKTDLNLTSEQYTAMHSAYVEKITKQREYAGEFKKVKTKMKESSKDFSTKVKSSLNEDQLKKFKKMEKKKKKRMMKKHRR